MFASFVPYFLAVKPTTVSASVFILLFHLFANLLSHFWSPGFPTASILPKDRYNLALFHLKFELVILLDDYSNYLRFELFFIELGPTKILVDGIVRLLFVYIIRVFAECFPFRIECATDPNLIVSGCFMLVRSSATTIFDESSEWVCGCFKRMLCLELICSLTFNSCPLSYSLDNISQYVYSCTRCKKHYIVDTHVLKSKPK